MTGFPPKVRALIRQRAEGYCERCGLRRGAQIHHRRPRGMGGTRQESTNTASNGLLVCIACHELIEERRGLAQQLGFLVEQAQEPRNIPVAYRGRWAMLDDLGNVGELV